MLNQQGLHINLTGNRRGCVGVSLLYLLCACLPSLTTLEWTDQQHFAKTKLGYTSLPSILNAIIGITSYYCVILKMMVIGWCNKNNSEWGFYVFLRKRTRSYFFKKNKQTLFNTKKQVGCFSFLKMDFLNPVWHKPSCSIHFLTQEQNFLC